MPTKLIIDEKFISLAMEVSGLTTKNEVVELALREFIARRQRHNINELFNKPTFNGGYDHIIYRQDQPE
ncbi:MAG: type II toxin-antitoxin system VapB family antitoxin [Deltaproteobacteria bacterium]|jgi:Arc/MetJ family transcription regulator|nr:type II toxin-antitoxin system VapB family antitoxin [Deltaproteobacteria bacterium]